MPNTAATYNSNITWRPNFCMAVVYPSEGKTHVVRSRITLEMNQEGEIERGRWCESLEDGGAVSDSGRARVGVGKSMLFATLMFVPLTSIVAAPLRGRKRRRQQPINSINN